ncbi:MAG: HAMP domain-containing histidine kinase, partial [Nonomuraea sp.]|nr:HAMP domain-containing histidine kinase [Nonomuraea sp.]
MRPGTWTLRARLVATILALTTLGLVAANVFGVALLSGNQLARVDEGLGGMRKALTTKTDVVRGPTSPLPGPKPGTAQALIISRAASAFRLYRITPSGVVAGVLDDGSQPGPDLRALSGEAGPYTVPGTSGAAWRVVDVPLDQGGKVVVASSLSEVESTRASLTAIAVTVSAAVLLLVGLAADALVRLGLRPLTRMESTAVRITRGDLGSRVPVPDPHTEPGKLGQALNTMLDRVTAEIAARTASEARMRRFLADASHELRTPLTSVRGFAELHRRGGGDVDETMRRIEDEAARMGVLVDDLLTLAQLDEERPLDLHRVDLLEVAAATIRDARVRVPDRQVRLAGLDDALEPVTVVG